jgi:hypothetical protein
VSGDSDICQVLSMLFNCHEVSLKTVAFRTLGSCSVVRVSRHALSLDVIIMSSGENNQNYYQSVLAVLKFIFKQTIDGVGV